MPLPPTGQGSASSSSHLLGSALAQEPWGSHQDTSTDTATSWPSTPVFDDTLATFFVHDLVASAAPFVYNQLDCAGPFMWPVVLRPEDLPHLGWHGPGASASPGDCDASGAVSFHNRGSRHRSSVDTPAESGQAERQGSRASKRRRGGPATDERRAMEVLAEAQFAFLEGQRSGIWKLACADAKSSSAVQKAIDMVAVALSSSSVQQDDLLSAQALLADLQGNVREALDHRHANHVIKQLVQLMPTKFVGFVAAELIGAGYWAASHQFGCRTVLRLVHHCGGSDRASKRAEALIDEVLERAADLGRTKYGIYVLQEVLEHGLPHQRDIAAGALCELESHKAMYQLPHRVGACR